MRSKPAYKSLVTLNSALTKTAIPLSICAYSLAAYTDTLPSALKLSTNIPTRSTTQIYLQQPNTRNHYSTMSSKLIPSNPADVMTIRDITPRITTLSVPFARHGIFRIGGRATLVKLTAGPIAVFSPVALTDQVRAKITAMGGNLGYIIAPDLEHHIFVSEWASAFPNAKIIGPEGLPEKRAGSKDEHVNRQDVFHTVFRAADKRSIKIDAEFDADFDYEYVDGHANKELVFLFRPDRTLIQADFLFNLPAKEQYSRVPPEEAKGSAFLNRIFNGCQTTEGDLTWPRRFTWYLVSSPDRTSFNKSVKRINTWDFDTIIPCHGEVMQGDGKQRFERFFEWHLNA